MTEPPTDAAIRAERNKDTARIVHNSYIQLRAFETVGTILGEDHMPDVIDGIISRDPNLVTSLMAENPIETILRVMARLGELMVLPTTDYPEEGEDFSAAIAHRTLFAACATSRLMDVADRLWVEQGNESMLDEARAALILATMEVKENWPGITND